MSSNKASMMVGHDRFELSTNGLKVRSESAGNQSDGPREIYGRHPLKARIGAGRAGYFTEAAGRLLAAIAMLIGSASVHADVPSGEPPDIPLRKCTFPYLIAPHATITRFCAGPPPAMLLISGNDLTLVSVARHTDRPIGAVITIHNPTNRWRRGAAVVEFF